MGRVTSSGPRLEIHYIDGAMPGLVEGSRVEYTGDVCNRARIGTVTRVWEDRWGHFFDLTCDAEDGEASYLMRGLPHGNFGGLAPRFHLLRSIEIRHDGQVRIDALAKRWGCSPEEAVRRALIGTLARIEHEEEQATRVERDKNA